MANNLATSYAPRVIVVGGGLAGLAASARIADMGLPVDLFSLVPVKRSHSVCAQGGINACNEVARQQGYSEYEHFDESIYGGDFLAHQPPVYEMAHAAPKIIDLLDRMGVPFNRTAEGQHDLRLFGGSLYKRTHFAGATTGQQLIYALDEQVRRHETDGKITKYEHWEFLRPIIDSHSSATASGEGLCRGIVAQDLRSMRIRAFRADAVVMATGGCGLVFGKSTNSVMCTGAAAARCFQAGARYANPEFIQVHPTAIPGADKLRLMSESARGEGGRVWTPAIKGPDGIWARHPDPARDPRKIPDSERYYFLEEKFPAYGNIVPRDIATREIFNICLAGLGVAAGRMVYLDLSFKPREELERKLGGIIDIYRKFVGEDPCLLPMKIFPAVHYSMGGLWTTYTPDIDYPKIESGESILPDKRNWNHLNPPKVGLLPGAPNNMMTNINGLYAFGEANYQYHGANRLGANALLSCIFDGLFCGPSVTNFVRDTPARSPPPQSLFDSAVADEESKQSLLINSSGAENPYLIALELGDEMTDASTVVKTEPRLRQALHKLDDFRDRYTRITLSDTGSWTNQTLSWARIVGDMIALADPILRAGLAREESRGSHYREDFPQRNDERFMKTSVAAFDPASGHSTISFEPIASALVKPRRRSYGKIEAGAASENPALTSAAS